MKPQQTTYTKAKRDNSSLILLAVLILVLIIYGLCFLLWLKGMWNVPLAQLEVRHGAQLAGWGAAGKFIHWFIKREFLNR